MINSYLATHYRIGLFDIKIMMLGKGFYDKPGRNGDLL